MALYYKQCKAKIFASWISSNTAREGKILQVKRKDLNKKQSKGKTDCKIQWEELLEQRRKKGKENVIQKIADTSVS